MIFIDLENAYDRIPREIMWYILEKKYVRKRYIVVIKDMYGGGDLVQEPYGENLIPFEFIIGLRQRSTLSPFLFALVIDDITRHIKIRSRGVYYLRTILF